jgi:hypothetical protein
MRSLVEHYLTNTSGVEKIDLLNEDKGGFFEYAGKNERYECLLTWSYFIEKKDEDNVPASLSIWASPPSIVVPQENRATILEFLNSANQTIKMSSFTLHQTGSVTCQSAIYAESNDILNEAVFRTIFTETLVYLEICSPLIQAMINSRLTLKESEEVWSKIPKLFSIPFFYKSY